MTGPRLTLGDSSRFPVELQNTRAAFGAPFFHEGTDGVFLRMCTITALYAAEVRSVHSQVHHHFNQERHVVTRSVYQQSRSAALEEWRALAA